MRQRIFEHRLIPRIFGVFKVVQNASPGKLQAFSFSLTRNLLFAFDGSVMRFVTDFIWRSPLGLRINAQDTAGVSQTEDWVKQVRDLTGGEGVPVVYDSTGKDTFEGSLDCLAVRGMMVSFGNSSGAVPAFEPGILSAKGSLYLTRPTLQSYARTPEELQAAADDLFAVISSGAVKIAIHQRFALADARKAHEALHSRATTGATVLIP